MMVLKNTYQMYVYCKYCLRILACTPAHAVNRHGNSATQSGQLNVIGESIIIILMQYIHFPLQRASPN